MKDTGVAGTLRPIATGFGLLEGARWYPEWGLVFSDMTGGGVFGLAPTDNQPLVIIPHRKGIGGLVAHEDGGFVVAGRNVAHKTADGNTHLLLSAAEDEVFFNDLTADREGRILVGSVAIDPLASDDDEAAGRKLGRLYSIDVDGASSVLFDDVAVSNGIATSPSAGRVYHVDTGRNLIWAIDMTGPRREPFVDTSEYDGEPDGLAVAEDGSVWVAMAGGGVVIAWDEQGRRVHELEIPQKLVTSVCFGGDDRSTLFILTGASPGEPPDEGGSVYTWPAPVAGLPAPVARVRA